MTQPRQQRRSTLEKLATDRFDVLVVGAGITGAGIARDAALRGLRVALVDQADIAGGTSSRSSRLVHGGLRYLEQFRLRLVAESTTERARLMRQLPHLVRPLPFLYPLYGGSKPGRALLGSGLWLYDALALFRTYKRHRHLSTAAVRAAEPGLRSASLKGAFTYFDGLTDDARLTLENVLDAQLHGATVASYVRFVDLNRTAQGAVRGAVLEDAHSQERFDLQADLVISAAGPWTDDIRRRLRPDCAPMLRPTKGIHLVFAAQRLPLRHAVVMKAALDGRVTFAVPCGEITYVGTTDTDVAEDALCAKATAADVAYLLDTVNRDFPAAALTTADIQATWAGLRPLIRQDADSAYQTSREHEVHAGADGFADIAGGKLTTYRNMACEALEKAWQAARNRPDRGRLPTCRTKTAPFASAQGLHGYRAVAATAQALQDQSHFRPATAEHLVRQYGHRAFDIARAVQGEPALGQPIVSELPHIWAEVRYSAEQELVESLCDFLIRRTSLMYRAPDQGRAVCREVAARLGQILEWSSDREEREVAAYLAALDENMSFRKEQEIDSPTKNRQPTASFE